MAITYIVDPEAGLLLVKWAGSIAAEDLVAFGAAVRADEAALKCKGSITDVRESVIRFTGEELRSVTEQLFTPAKARGKIWRTAVVVAKPVHVGVARQHEIFSADLKSTGIFFSEREAREWVLAG